MPETSHPEAGPPQAPPPEAPARDATDLHALLIRDPATSLLLRVSGDSMGGAGIHAGDLLVVDRALTPRPGHVVVALLAGAFTLKRLVRRRGRWWLEAAHPAYPPIPLAAAGPADDDVRLWGVAVHVIRRL